MQILLLKNKKKKKLSQIARAFGISKDELDSFIQSFGNLKGSQKNLSLEEAYKILELNQNADLNLVKK